MEGDTNREQQNFRTKKISIKIFQFKFLVMTEKNISVHKSFLSLNTLDWLNPHQMVKNF